MTNAEAERRELLSRAYGRNPDIAGDGAALRRLAELYETSSLPVEHEPVYGRGASATPERIARPNALERDRSSDLVQDSAPPFAPGTEPTTSDEVRHQVPARNRFTLTPWSLVACAAIFAAGIAIGSVAGSATTGTVYPVTAPIPPLADELEPTSVVYFGEVENARVWFARRPATAEICIVYSTMSGSSGGASCAPEDETTVSGVVEDGTTSVEYVVTVPSAAVLPQLTAHRSK